MANPQIPRGLMGAPAPNASAGSRMTAAIQRMRQRQQQPRQQPRPRPIPQQQTGGYDGSGINPQRRPMPAPPMQGAPLQPPPGLPARPGQATSQNTGGIVPPHMQQGAPPPRVASQMPRSRPMPNPAPAAPAGAGMTAVVPTDLHPTMQGAPTRPAGAPAAPSGINPRVPGVAMPDVARAPRPEGGLMNQMPAPRY